MPFTVQRNRGVGPPKVVDAVNVAGEPAHTVLPGSALMLMVGMAYGITDSVTVLLAVSGEAHGVLVMRTEITSPLTGVKLYTLPVLTVDPFTLHT